MNAVVSLKVLNTKSDIGTLQFLIQNLYCGVLAPKLKSCCIYLKISTLVNLKVLNTNLARILPFVTQNLNFGKLISKLISFWIYLEICTGTNFVSKT